MGPTVGQPPRVPHTDRAALGHQTARPTSTPEPDTRGSGTTQPLHRAPGNQIPQRDRSQPNPIQRDRSVHRDPRHQRGEETPTRNPRQRPRRSSPRPRTSKEHTRQHATGYGTVTVVRGGGGDIITTTGRTVRPSSAGGSHRVEGCRVAHVRRSHTLLVGRLDQLAHAELLALRSDSTDHVLDHLPAPTGDRGTPDFRPPSFHERRREIPRHALVRPGGRH
jgi:hypothetical protein